MRQLLTTDEIRALAYRASSVAERANLIEAHGPGAVRTSADDQRLATLCQTWIQAFSPGDAAAFERRLGWDELTLDTLRGALAEVEDTAIAVDSTWTSWLSRMLECAPDLIDELASTDAPLAERAWFAETTEPPFVEILLAGWRAADAHLSATYPTWETTLPAVKDAFGRQLVKDLSGFAELTLHDQFRRVVARAGGDGAPSRSRYQSFVLGLLRGNLVALWSGYPVLARHMATVLEMWCVWVSELLERVARDGADLERTFGEGRPLGPLVGVSGALSDPHHGRRRVLACTFDSGVTVIYKPRDVALEAAYAALIAWANDDGLVPTQSAIPVLARQGYGWCGFARSARFSAREDVERYYRQAGGLLALAYVLRARDLQMENVIATARGPVLIDLEMLFQPVADKDLDEHGHPRPESCLSSGLLSLAHVGPGDLVYDIGGLRGDGVTPTSLSRRRWVHQGTDQVGFVEDRVISEPTGNRVYLENDLQRPDDHVSSIAEGFASTYRFLLERREALLSDDGPLSVFAGCRCRVVFRSSQHYAALQYSLAAPRYQSSGVTRTCALDTLNRVFNRDTERPPMWSVVTHELRALEALDIPRFWLTTTDVEISSDDGPVEGRHYARSGFELVRTGVAKLSDLDMEKQLAAIRATLASAAGSRLSTSLPTVPDAPHDPTPALRAQAEALGMEMLARADRLDGRLSWEGQRVEQGPWKRHTLYTGSLGSSLFFAGLFAVTGAPDWRTQARATAAGLLRQASVSATVAPDDLGLGGCSGFGSLLYGLTTAGALLGDEEFHEAARAVAGFLTPAHVSADAEFDIAGGAAGAILGLLALHGRQPDDRYLSLAVACGDHLLEAQQPQATGAAWPVRRGKPLAGFAHGCAGIAHALLKLAAATGVERYIAAAEQAHAHEASLFAPALGNWPVIGALDAATGSGYTVMTSWCHGGPGIALARVLNPEELRDSASARDIEAGLHATQRAPLGWLDQVCCGNLGRSDILTTVGRRLDRPELVDAGRSIAVRAADRASRRQLFGLRGGGVDYRVFDPGFFRGLAGIGYQLLRTTAPQVLPSVLAFESVSVRPRHEVLS